MGENTEVFSWFCSFLVVFEWLCSVFFILFLVIHGFVCGFSGFPGGSL